MAIYHDKTRIVGGFTFTDTTLTTSAEGLALVADSSNAWGVKIATAGDTVIGVVTDTTLYNNGDPIALAVSDGTIVDCLAGGAGFAIGDKVKATTAGAVITAGSTDPYFGIAVETATSGNFGAVCLTSGGSIATNVTFTRASTTLYPTTTADTVATGPRAGDAAVIEMVANSLTTQGTGTNVNLVVTCKGSGTPTFTNSTYTAAPILVAAKGATQGTTTSSGIITNTAVTTNAVVFFTAAVAGADGPVSVVPTASTLTFYDNVGSVVNAKKVNYIIISY